MCVRILHRVTRVSFTKENKVSNSMEILNLVTCVTINSKIWLCIILHKCLRIPLYLARFLANIVTHYV